MKAGDAMQITCLFYCWDGRVLLMLTLVVTALIVNDMFKILKLMFSWFVIIYSYLHAITVCSMYIYCIV